MHTAKVIKNYRRARSVIFPPLLIAREKRERPYHAPLVQEKNFLPDFEWGSREHALYLWALDYYMKGGITSTTAIQNMTRFYKDYPEVFLPENFNHLTSEEEHLWIEWLKIILPQYGLGVNYKETGQFWVWNLQKLNKFWNNDPRNLFKCTEKDAERSWKSFRVAKRNYEGLCKVLMRSENKTHKTFLTKANGFYGYAHKMVSMLAYFYIHASMIKPFAYPVPVDFHILRVLVITLVLRVKGAKVGWEIYRERLLEPARDVTLRFIVETGCNPQHLADVLWLLSRSFCRWHPGNSSSVGKEGRARKRGITHRDVLWTYTTTRRYEETCGQCRLLGKCSLNFPSSYYYVKGKVKVKGMRDFPHQLPLHEIPVSAVAKKVKQETNGKEHDEEKHQLILFD